MTHSHAHAGHHHHGAGDHLDDAVLGELLDLDAVALADSWAQIHALVAAAAPTAVSTVVDLGAGTGTGTVALARLFPAATVIAVDSNPALPERLAAKGAGERVRPVVADLDHGWPDLGAGVAGADSVDVVWASMSLHHLGDPDRSLRDVFAAMAPGGLLAAVEFDEPVRVLARGAAGDVEDRAMQALRGVHERDVPEIGSHWAPRFAAAGFDVVGESQVGIDIPSPTAAGVRYAQLWLQRMAAGVDRLDPADVATLRELSSDDGIAEAAARGDVHLHGVRSVTLARRF